MEGQISQKRYGFTDKKRKQDTKNDRTSKTSELRELRAQIQNLQLEVDILKEMLDVLKNRHQLERPEKQGEGSDDRCHEEG